MGIDSRQKLAVFRGKAKQPSRKKCDKDTAIVKHVFAYQETTEKNSMRERQQSRKIFSAMLVVLCMAAPFGFDGCGETAKPVTSASATKVYSYFGSPFSVSASSVARSSSTFDHATNQIGVSGFITTASNAQVPTAIINGTLETAGTGFLKITENFAPTSSGVIGPQNPPLTGAWALEIPGAGVLANLLNVNSSNPSAVSVAAAPAAMADNTACPNFVNAAPFWYVTVPNAAMINDTADYGGVDISTQGSDVILHTQPFLVGPIEQPASVVTGGCSNTSLGALTAYPLNSFATPSNLELISIGASGLLVSSFEAGASGTSPGAFGGGTGVIGVAVPSSPVDVGAVSHGQYNGFIYAPLNRVTGGYDIKVLASAFGDNAGTSQACSTLQTSLAANNGQGSGSIPVLPSANSLYGGEFLTTTSSGTVNDPTGASGSEDCDVVIDLGTQDPVNNGLFPNATIFIGSNYPPYSASRPWVCAGSTSACAVSFPAAAIVGKVQGRYVIFVAASAGSSPPARLPDNVGSAVPQPVGIYLFQKSQ
jgi:hypothetical protein